jgi:hypothetical protein
MVNTLATLHETHPDKFPKEQVWAWFEELTWRFWEEMKEILRQLKKEVGRQNLTAAELKFYALMPDEAGRAWLQMPTAFDLHNPEGWFRQEIIPRVERRQDRMLWSLTWKGPGGNTRQPAHAGGEEEENEGDERTGQHPTLKSLWGPKLTKTEVDQARTKAPNDGQGNPLCWGNLTWLGCERSAQDCLRSHAPLKGKLGDLDYTIQAQFLRRGGLKRDPLVKKQEVEKRIESLRSHAKQDKDEKVKDGKARGKGAAAKAAAREKAGSAETPEPPPAAEPGPRRTGGQSTKSVRFDWKAPEEFEPVNFTEAESELRQMVEGPTLEWLTDHHPGGTAWSKEPLEVPQRAKELLQQAEEAAEGPVLSKLALASDDLYAYAAA